MPSPEEMREKMQSLQVDDKSRAKAVDQLKEWSKTNPKITIDEDSIKQYLSLG